MKRCAFALALTAAILATPGITLAEDAPPTAEPAAPASPLTGSFTLVSDYNFRGLTQTNAKPAVQGGLEYDDPSGFYIGTWASSISWLSDMSLPGAHVSANLELDLYLGYRGKFNDDLGYDVGLYEDYYPGSYYSGFVRPYNTEIYGALTYKFLSLKYSHTLTNLFGVADSKNSGYLDLSANYEFVPNWLLNAHIGHQRVDGHSALSYTDYKLGVTKNLDKGFSLALAYYDTDADRPLYTNLDDRFVGRSTVILAINKAF